MSSAKPYDIAKRTVWEAYQQVRANRGAAGIDDETIADFERDLSKNLYKLWNRMSSGSYFPPPVKQVEIPKASGGTRKLGVPTVGDRVAQTVVTLLIEPELESACGLMMYPGKSKVMYCKDSNRGADHPHVRFTFLGFTFRPGKALSKQGRLFTSFLPGASADALKRMRQAVHRWRLNRQTHVTLDDVARLYNPVIQGWWHYYGSFYRTSMLGIFRHIDRALERWARRKYKALHRRKQRISQWLDKMRTMASRLFHHWRVAGQ